MYKVFLKYIMIIISGLIVFSCQKEEPSFSKSLLTGKWQSGTEYYRYFSDGSGYTWDTSDDVREDEAQKFTWSLVKSELKHLHQMETGGTVPKIYKVLELSSTTLRYRDDFGKSFSYIKVND